MKREWTLLPVALALGTFALATFRLLSRGFLPTDDVLRHAAFALAGKPWNQILLGRPEALFDQSPGWHALLKGLHALTGMGPEGLATAAMGLGLMAFFASGLLWVRRWEAWAVAVAFFCMTDSALLLRLAIGRPLVLTAALTVCLLGSLRREEVLPWCSWKHLGWTLGAALATWIHGSWYLLFLVPLALLVTERWREALRMGAALAVGCLMGALLTGHPVTFLWGQVAHLLHALGRPQPTWVTVPEFLPARANAIPLLGVALVALWRRESLLKSGLRPHPALVLGLLGWLLGRLWVWRFLLDWAMPALILWTAWQLEELLGETSQRWWPRARLSLAAALFFLAVINPTLNDRFTQEGSGMGLDPRIPKEASLLPEPGGVLYSPYMTAFFSTFFHNPKGDWKYVLGYEPGMMRDEDRDVVIRALKPGSGVASVAPWLVRMTPRDRVLLYGPAALAPSTPGIAWTFAEPDKWVGRKLSPASAALPPAVRVP